MPRGVASERIELAVKALREAVATPTTSSDLRQLLRDAVPEFNPASDDEPVRDATVVAFPARRSRLNS